MADRNVHVSKSSSGNTTNSQSVVLNGEKLFAEIARLMGAGVDELALKASAQLKEKCNQYKLSI